MKIFLIIRGAKNPPAHLLDNRFAVSGGRFKRGTFEEKVNGSANRPDMLHNIIS